MPENPALWFRADHLGPVSRYQSERPMREALRRYAREDVSFKSVFFHDMLMIS